MTQQYAAPGVYIEEQIGPGVIAGVSTSVAAFIGPALRGPINEARRVTTYDEFLNLYGIARPDGTVWPFITDPHPFYLAHAVRGFFVNAGSQAMVVRVGSGRATEWLVENQAGEPVFRLRAREEGVGGDGITIAVQAANATGAGGVTVATGSATVTAVAGVAVTVNNAAPFRVGDTVTENEASRATITHIAGNDLTLSAALAGLANGDTLRIANLLPTQNSFRVQSTAGLWAGSVVLINGDDAANPGNQVNEHVVVEVVNPASGFVTLAASPARTNTYNLAPAAATPTTLVSQEFRLIVTPPPATGAPAEPFDNLALSPLHPGHVFNAVNSAWVRVLPPDVPPVTATYPQRLVAPAANVAIALNGQNDDPAALTSAEYQAGLDVLVDIDDVSIVCIPDAAAHAERATIQRAMIDHCLLPGLQDRVAVLDSAAGAPPFGPGSVEEQRQAVEAERGFAALYYPWLEVRDPSSTVPIPARMLVPPSGHLAGVWARTDAERGVHKAPANTPVRGILGLERVLSDRQHGPLNLAGVNVLRVFPGSDQVIVWGDRTTIDPNITDFLYLNVRRTMNFIEESIAEGIRWAVFEPNSLKLWQQLRRTIRQFLTSVWRSGGLFGETPDRAFYVRIDEGLNPPESRALGRLYIEIGVAPVRPAEFIIVRIGLWDGGSEVTEA
jgi:phage tail sheath protein FI